MDNAVITTAPKIIPVLTDPANLWVNICLTFFTFLAVLTALFQERVKRRWNRTRLDMFINLSPPDCHKIDLMSANHRSIPSIYIRIKVIHRGGKPGENVEIIPTNFYSCEGNVVKKLDHFLPISLTWSHFEKTNTIRVPKQMFRHCDFGCFTEYPGPKPGHRKSVLKLDTIVQPNPVANNKVPNIIHAGKYEFELLLSGDNVRPLKKRWRLEFDKWSADEKEMLEDNIKLYEVS